MCTLILKKIEIVGTGKGADGWFPIKQANVSYDHPYYAPLDHALNIDFVNEDLGLGARVAVELSTAAARTLAHSILAALEEADQAVSG